MKLAFLKSVTASFVRIVTLQLFISLIAMPILISWGLPMSLASPLGNIIFNPFIMAFLFIASLIFFTSLLCIPNGLLIWILEQIATWWDFCIQWHSDAWLIGFRKPSYYCLFLIPIGAFLLMHARIVRTPWAMLIAQGLYTFIIIIILKYYPYQTPHVFELDYAHNKITVIHDHGKTTVIDPGVLGSKQSASSWVIYTLIPEIIKNTGNISLDAVVSLQLNSFLCETLTALCENMHVRIIYLPSWRDYLPRHTYKAWKVLCSAAQQRGTIIKHLYHKPLTHHMTDSIEFTITPLDQIIHHYDASYYMYKITSCINEKNVTIYSHKYKNKAHTRL